MDDFKIMDYLKTLRVQENNGDIIISPIDPKNHKETFIFLHRVASSPKEYLPPFYSENTPFLPTTRVVLLKAPKAYIKLLDTTDNSWYNIYHVDKKKIRNMEELAESISLEELDKNAVRVNAVLEEEIKLLNGDASRVFLGGFSQGGCTAVKVGFESRHKIGGIFCAGGYVPPKCKVPEGKELPPVFFYSGMKDRMVPTKEITVFLFEFFVKNGVKSTVRAYPEVYHEFSVEMIEDLKRDFRTALLWKNSKPKE